MIDLDKDVLYKLYIEEDKTQKEISEILNIKKRTICFYLKKFNLTKRKEQPIDRDILYDLYIAQNKTCNEVAKILGFSVRKTQDHLRKNKIRKIKRTESQNKEGIEEMVLLYNNNLTLKEISRELNYTIKYIKTTLKDLGVYRNRKIQNKIIIGNYFKNIEILEEYEKYQYLCKCFCGNIFKKSRSFLFSSKKPSCGCILKGKFHSGWRGYEDISKLYWRGILYDAEKRKINFDITIEFAWDLYIKQNKKCAITGLDIKMRESNTFGKRINRKESLGIASLDRIDSSKGYTEDNVHWVLSEINTMKMGYSMDLFLYLCEKVYENNKGK
jgi:DNA-binding CsgD family transcriptional regulator